MSYEEQTLLSLFTQTSIIYVPPTVCIFNFSVLFLFSLSRCNISPLKISADVCFQANAYLFIYIVDIFLGESLYWFEGIS